MKVGVFDSGVGGLSVANAIKAELPNLEIILKEDKDNIPYGTKTPKVLYDLVRPIIDSMINKDQCKTIVIACNTVSTTLIDKLRQDFNIPFIAIEPMIKPASEVTRNRIIAVCATPTTLSSSRYKSLLQQYAADIKVLEPDCSNWALMIQNDQTNSIKLDESINEVIELGADVIVLACTHYHWIEDKIRAIVSNRATVMQPEAAIIRRLQQVIEQLA